MQALNPQNMTYIRCLRNKRRALSHLQGTHQAGPRGRWEYEGRARSVADQQPWTREKRGKATQVTFRQVSVGGTSPAEGKCTWVPSALFSYKHGRMFLLYPQPLPGNPAVLHNTWIAGSCGHQTLKSVIRGYQMLVQIHWKPKLSIHSPLGMKGKQ